VEYYFIVRPGGDPARIQLHFSGATKTRLTEHQIEISVIKGNWRERIPESYLDSGISYNRRKTTSAKGILVNFRQIATDTYGFEIGAYDHSRTLIIDPTPDLIWGTYLGGALNDWSDGISKDANGNIFIGGSSANATNIATSGAYQTVLDGYSDAILGKFSSDGQLLWLTYYGGSEEDAINGLATDNNNDIIAVGSTFSYDNISTPGSYKPVKISPDGSSDAFIAKFTNDGNLQWATYYGGDSGTQSSGVVIDNVNNIYIAAWTNSANGISTPGAYQTTYGGGGGSNIDDGCVAKFTSEGAMQWSTYYGDNSFDRFYGIAIDKAQNLYLAGITYSTKNIASPNAYQPNFGGGISDAFLVKFTNGGTRLWATYYGGSGEEHATSVCTDGMNNVFICGLTASTSGMSTPGTQQPLFGGNDRDGFLAKFTSEGKLSWGSYYGGNGQDNVDAITSDDQNNIFITGSTVSTNNISTPGSYQPSPGGPGLYWTTYLTMFNNDGIRQWGTYYGMNGPYAAGEGYALVTSGEYVYVTGVTLFTDNIATCDAYQKTWEGGWDVFLAKFGKGIQPVVPSISISADRDEPICTGQALNFTATVQNMGNDYSYQWYWNGNPVGTNSAVYSNNQLAEMDSIRCTVQKSSSCSAGIFNSNSIIIHIDPGLPATVSITGPASPVCQGAKVLFTTTTSNAGSEPSYQWKVNAVNEGTDSSAFVTTSLLNGDEVTCTVTHHGACSMDSIATSNPVTIIVKPIPEPSIVISASADPVCSGTPVVFTAAAVNAGNIPSFQWELDGEKVGSDSNGYTNSSLTSGDQIDCMLTASTSECFSDPIRSNIIMETVYAKPEISIQGDSIIRKGVSSQLQAIASANVNTFKWTPASSLSSSTIPNPIATPIVTTSYMVEVTDTNGCTADKIFTIEVITKISIPNAFSPNGDGKNDLFRAIYGSDITQVMFSIYNRWGQLVFEDRGTHKGWDGNLGGKPQPAGAYVWEFRYKTNIGEFKILKGSLLLIK
jgi:gliding motility-associated-like protein